MPPECKRRSLPMRKGKSLSIVVVLFILPGGLPRFIPRLRLFFFIQGMYRGNAIIAGSPKCPVSIMSGPPPLRIPSWYGACYCRYCRAAFSNSMEKASHEGRCPQRGSFASSSSSRTTPNASSGSSGFSSRPAGNYNWDYDGAKEKASTPVAKKEVDNIKKRADIFAGLAIIFMIVAFVGGLSQAGSNNALVIMGIFIFLCFLMLCASNQTRKGFNKYIYGRH